MNANTGIQATIDAKLTTNGNTLTKDAYAERRIRKGKTMRDRESGAKHKNEQNRQSRASWQNDTKNTTFPWSSCNGKRNRYQVTGKDGETVYLTDKKK